MRMHQPLKLAGAALCALAAGLVAVAAGAAAEGEKSREIIPIDPSAIVRFEGDGAAIGRAHGTVLREEIQTLLNGWLLPRLRTVPLLVDVYARAKVRNMEPFLPDDLAAEIRATADAAGVDPVLVQIANAVPDIMELVRRPFGCSTFVALPGRSATGQMLYGRNLDYAGSELLRSHWRPTVFARDGKLQILSINVPGMSGVLTAINEKGVMMSRMTSYNRDITSHGMPTMVLFRKVLEEATTAEEAAELYLRETRTVAINIMISDPTTALVLETTATKHAIRKPNDAGVLYSANHFETPELADWRGKRDWRWPHLAARDADARKVTVDDVIGIVGDTGKDGDNVLAVVADYANKRLIIGSDPEGNGRSARGQLYSLSWDTAFARR